MNKQKVPKLRFTEFTEEWEENNFKNVFKINQGLQIPITKRFLTNGENRYFYITNEFLKKNSSNRYYISNPSKSVVCNKNDILMTRTGNTGKVVTNVEGVFHNNFFKIDFSRSNYSEIYIYQLLTSRIMQNKIASLAGTSTIPDLNHSDFYSIKSNFPSLPEQEKIADFLTLFDEEIELEEKKVELLKENKKGYMQKIFSQEIRFKDEFGNDYSQWEEKKLGEIFKINAGGDIKKENVSLIKTSSYCYPIYANSDKNKGLYGYSNLYKYNENNLTVTGRGNLGVANGRYEKFYPIVRLLILQPLNNENIKFFEEAINNINFYFESTGVPQLTGPQVSNYKINTPSLPEQEKIANFLSTVDEEIELMENKIEKLKEIKKGLLQQMFI